MAQSSPVDLWQYLRDALSILRVSLELADRDHPEFYRVVAAQLRLLLCDTTRRHQEPVEISLAPRLITDLSFHPLREGLAFDRTAQPLPLGEWLDQSLGELTIRQLIRRVCEQDGGVHIDPRWAVQLPQNRDFRGMILAVGEYVLDELSHRLP